MRVEDLSVAVRPRRAFEAVDLGFALLRQHARAVLTPWLWVALPLGALLLLIFWMAPYGGLLAWRWMKPLLDRVPLHVLARATFSQVPGPGETLKELWRGPRAGLLSGLTWRRLAPGRAMAAPVFQLEGLKGKAFRARWTVLARSGGGAAAALMLICLVFEAVVLLALLALLAILLPSHLHFMDWIFEHKTGLGGPRCLLALHVLATSVVEPYFVAGGFALYLNRRTALEGWDIELAFRRMARRLAPALLCLVFAAAPPAAAAPQTAQSPPPQETPKSETPKPEAPPPGKPKPAPRPDDPVTPTPGTRPEGEAKRAAVEVLKRREFGELKEVRIPEWMRTDRKRRPRRPFELQWLGEFLAPFVKGGAVAALFAALAWILWRFRDRIGDFLRPGRRAAPLDTLFGLDIRPESLPDDVGAAAWKLWVAGDPRAALALLYRGSLSGLVHGHEVALHAGSTEGDALRLAGNALPAAGLAYFGDLTQAWLHLAYRHEAPGPEVARALCDAWPRHFQARMTAP